MYCGLYESLHGEGPVFPESFSKVGSNPEISHILVSLKESIGAGELISVALKMNTERGGELEDLCKRILGGGDGFMIIAKEYWEGERISTFPCRPL